MRSDKASVSTELDFTIEEINRGGFAHKKLGFGGAKRVAACLRANPNAKIYTLDLSGNYLTDAGVLLILEALPKNDHCEILRLSHNGLTNATIVDVMDWVVAHKNLKELNLFSNSLNNKIAQAFGFRLSMAKHLTKINIGKNDFKYASMNFILAGIQFRDNKNLVELHLPHSKINTTNNKELIEKILNENLGLTTLNLAGCELNGKFTNDVLKAATTHPSLQVLDLSSNNIRGLDEQVLLDLFKQNTTLTSINLSENKLNNDCIANLNRAYQYRNPNSKIQLIFSETNSVDFNNEASNNNNQDNKDDRNTFKRRKI
jgi:Ran GTPase-activating protein (RanGAP) involved in mRNA processing and transport